MLVTIGAAATPFTLTDLSGGALILGSPSYDFSCTDGTSLALTLQVSSRRTDLLGGNLFPVYGLFVLAAIPPASSLFVSILPDVQITTAPLKTDTVFHAYSGSGTITNPHASRFLVFAVTADLLGTAGNLPTNYAYQNFTASGPGLPCGSASTSLVYDALAAAQFGIALRQAPRS